MNELRGVVVILLVRMHQISFTFFAIRFSNKKIEANFGAQLIMPKKDLPCSEYVVAWLDLPGQREKIKKIPHIPSTAEERDHFVGCLREALKPVKEFRSMIEGLCEGRAGNDSATISNRNWDIIAQPIWQRHSQVSINREFISDAALLKVGLEESPKRDPLSSVLAICDVVQSVILSCLANRSSVRGGIDVHVGFEIEPGSLYGPAVVNAYELETECADYPRVVFGPGFMGYLEYKKNQLDQPEIDQREKAIINGFLKSIGDLITFDVDGLPVLNFLFHGGVPIQQFNSLVQDSLKFVEDEVRRYRTESKIKLFMRYSRLLNFMKSRIRII